MGKCNPLTRIIPAVCAWVLLLSATGLYFAFPCRYLMSLYGITIPIVQGLVTFFVIINFALATFVNPGIIPKATTDEIQINGIASPMYKDIEIRGIRVRLKWCVTCQFYRPPRCVHCGICDKCIEHFDHHCPWVNNCIGRRNYRYFFMFLLWLSIHMIGILGLCIIYIKDHTKQLKELQSIITMVIIGVIIILFIPIFGLTIYHVMLIIQGKTTNEQVTGKFSDSQNPYARGCCKNVLSILCSSQIPTYPLNFDSTGYPIRNIDENKSINEAYTNSSMEKASSGFKFAEHPHRPLRAIQSQDCESAINSHLNRDQLHLSLNESIYTKQSECAYKSRNHRALTPPVPIRFDCSRRSLPPHNRLHAPSPHSVVNHLVQSATPHMSKNSMKIPACSSEHSSSYSYNSCNHQAPMVKHKYDMPFYGDMTYSNYPCNRKEIPNKSDGISFSSSELITNGKVLTSDTCCLGNQTVDKLQEIANRTGISGQCAEVSVLEAFPKGCSNFNNSANIIQTDISQLLVAQTPQQNYVNNSCIDYYNRDNMLCQNNSRELIRTPGNRPLSFVKAMEMSEALEWSTPSQNQIKSPSESVNYKFNLNPNTLQDKMHKSDQEISYEISV